MRRAAHPSGCAMCGAGAGCSAISYESLCAGAGRPAASAPARAASSPACGGWVSGAASTPGLFPGIRGSELDKSRICREVWVSYGTTPNGTRYRPCAERALFMDNILVQIHFIRVMMRWTGLAPLEFEFPFPGSLTSTFLELLQSQRGSSSGFALVENFLWLCTG